MTTHETDVLVVGAGPTGLVMAAELLSRGVRVRLVDKLAEPSDKSRALVVHARSLELFQKMGVADEVLAEGGQALGVAIYIEGRKRAELTFADIAASDTPYPYVLTLVQDQTERILTRHLERLGGRIERSVELLGFTQDEHGVTARLSDGATRCRFIVGADGAHSRVRKELGLSFDGAPYPQEFLLADVRLQDWPFGIDHLELFLSKGGLLALFPLRHRGLSRLILTRTGHLHPGTSEVSLEEVQAATRVLTGTQVRLTDAGWLTNFRLHHRGVDRYSKGRGFVAGDAAHIHSPAGGQGMNTGIQDAYNLAWKLALVVRGRAPESLLETYQSERHPVGQFLLKRTDRFFQVMATPSRTLLRLRNLLTPGLARLAANGPKRVRRAAFRFVSQLGIRYEPNAWIADGCGERAPDARLADGTTLFAWMRGPEHHLLCFGEEPTGVIDETICRKRLLGQDETEARERYAVGPGIPAFVLVRPDGHVALRCGAEGPLLKYLARFS